MYFGLYLIASRHREYDGLPTQSAYEEPGIFAALIAWFRRTFR
jgi:hypothetical protein